MYTSPEMLLVVVPGITSGEQLSPEGRLLSNVGAAHCVVGTTVPNYRTSVHHLRPEPPALGGSTGIDRHYSPAADPRSVQGYMRTIKATATTPWHRRVAALPSSQGWAAASRTHFTPCRCLSPSATPTYGVVAARSPIRSHSTPTTQPVTVPALRHWAGADLYCHPRTLRRGQPHARLERDVMLLKHDSGQPRRAAPAHNTTHGAPAHPGPAPRWARRAWRRAMIRDVPVSAQRQFRMLQCPLPPARRIHPAVDRRVRDFAGGSVATVRRDSRTQDRAAPGHVPPAQVLMILAAPAKADMVPGPFPRVGSLESSTVVAAALIRAGAASTTPHSDPSCLRFPVSMEPFALPLLSGRGIRSMGRARARSQPVSYPSPRSPRTDIWRTLHGPS